uniref:Uncharacterized protein n=1 Tax=Oryza punctata TaxID=4537 RepID=A0A0E0MH85_ORYPU
MSLETLEILKPEVMLLVNSLCSLKRLEFDTTHRFLEFPILPSSLESFIIRRCNPELLARWKRKEDKTRNRYVRHISEVQDVSPYCVKDPSQRELNKHFANGRRLQNAEVCDEKLQVLRRRVVPRPVSPAHHPSPPLEHRSTPRHPSAPNRYMIRSVNVKP